MTGPMAKANPFQFSTKYQEDETHLLYYGYRYYNAATGKWLSRDPAGEMASKHLYAFNDQNPVTKFDFLGLSSAAASTPPQPDPNPEHYPPYDPKHPERPSKKKVCILSRAIKPGTILNAGCGQCWRCDHQCRPGNSGGGYITRFQIGGCQKLTGYVPGWGPDTQGKSDCEAAGPDENPPMVGVPAND